jgi:hypothetical protein
MNRRQRGINRTGREALPNNGASRASAPSGFPDMRHGIFHLILMGREINRSY